MSFSLLFHHVRECTHDSIASLCSGIGIEDPNKKVRKKNLLFKRKKSWFIYLQYSEQKFQTIFFSKSILLFGNIGNPCDRKPYFRRDKVRHSPGLYNSNPGCYETHKNYWHEQRLVAPCRSALTTHQQSWVIIVTNSCFLKTGRSECLCI